MALREGSTVAELGLSTGGLHTTLSVLFKAWRLATRVTVRYLNTVIELSLDIEVAVPYLA